MRPDPQALILDFGGVIRPEFLTAIKKAMAAGIRLAVLSNELDLFYGSEFREKLPFLASFDVIADATYTGVLKPDPKANRDCLDQLGLPARACVFVDDQMRNINGAQSEGLRCVHFNVHQPQKSYRQALSLLGLS